MFRILLTNDDGIDAPGLRALEQAAGALGEVYVAAPAHEQSGAGRSITIHRPLRYREVGISRYAVEGTPTDTVMMALTLLLDFRPDLVISGVNSGANLGENIYYSGTVAAAAEAAKHDIPAIAVSVAAKDGVDFRPATEFVVRLGRQVLENGLPPGVALNVNVPHPSYEKVRITRQSPKISRNVMRGGEDPRGSAYYWMHEEVRHEDADAGTDYAAVREGDISVTPLHFEHTAHEAVEALGAWDDLF